VLRLVEFLGYSSLAVLMLAVPASAQQTRDTSHAYPWRGRVLYGGGPSVGAPPSDFTGETPPAQCAFRQRGEPLAISSVAAKLDRSESVVAASGAQ